jgi:hypothetical protein
VAPPVPLDPPCRELVEDPVPWPDVPEVPPCRVLLLPVDEPDWRLPEPVVPPPPEPPDVWAWAPAAATDRNSATVMTIVFMRC